MALFFGYLERSLGDASAGERAEHHLARAISELGEQRRVGASLDHGFTGVAWVAEHLADRQTASEDDDPNADIDTAILSILRRAPWKGDFDLLGGLVGWGVYALERMPHPSAEAMLPLVVSRLAESGERGPNGFSWRDRRDPAREPDGGMVHGAAGAIALLARLLQEGVTPPGTDSLLRAAVEDVLPCVAHRQAGGEGDLAWCTGYAGMSAALSQ